MLTFELFLYKGKITISDGCAIDYDGIINLKYFLDCLWTILQWLPPNDDSESEDDAFDMTVFPAIVKSHFSFPLDDFFFSPVPKYEFKQFSTECITSIKSICDHQVKKCFYKMLPIYAQLSDDYDYYMTDE